MGSNMVRRLLDKRHSVVVYDTNRNARRAAEKRGATAADDMGTMVAHLRPRRTIWIMVPHEHVDEVLKELSPMLRKGDTVIDGGNSHYKKTIQRANRLAKRGINFMDVGVSGGPKGALNGACLMVGGNTADLRRHEKLFRDLSVPDGYGHVGAHGAGHFVKMVHNGIEYGMMQAIAEGFHVLKQEKKFKLNLKKVARIYRHGSVIQSRLMDWMHASLTKYGPELGKVSGRADASGEGKWTTEEAHALDVPDKVIHEAVRARKRTHKNPNYQGMVIMALRNAFGGHSIKGDEDN